MSHSSTTGAASGMRSGFQRAHHVNVKRLHSEKVRLLYDNLWQPVLSSVLAGTLLVAAMWPVVESWILLTWLAALTLVSMARRAVDCPGRHRRRWDNDAFRRMVGGAWFRAADYSAVAGAVFIIRIFAGDSDRRHAKPVSRSDCHHQPPLKPHYS